MSLQVAECAPQLAIVLYVQLFSTNVKCPCLKKPASVVDT